MKSVTPAKAGVQDSLKKLDSGFRRNSMEFQLLMISSIFDDGKGVTETLH
jgi:hypothetical protein